LNLKNEFQIIYKLGSYTESVTGSFFCLQFKRWSKDEIVNALNRKCQCSPLDIKSDLHALKIPQNFHLHDRRLKNAINIALDKRKSYLRIQGKRAIFHAMEQTTRFDCDLLVNISLQYQYNPKQIVSEIFQHKKFSTQLMLHKQLNVKRPFVKALLKCAKFNLYY
jgi:hypothetical protein